MGYAMKKYKNLRGNSSVLSYESGVDYIHVVFCKGEFRNYLYDSGVPGKFHVDRMKVLAERGSGLGSYISTTVKSRYARKW